MVNINHITMVEPQTFVVQLVNPLTKFDKSYKINYKQNVGGVYGILD